MNPVRLLLRDMAGRVTDVCDDTLDLIQRRYQPRFDNSDLMGLPVTTCGAGDGRWFLCGENLSPSSVVYSVGVGYDISFDLDVINRFGCQLHAFDPTERSKVWLSKKDELPSQFLHHDFGLAHYSGTANFKLPKNHSVSFTMSGEVYPEAEEIDNGHQAEVKTLDDIMTLLGHDEIDLLKIDIEGAEYDIIGDLVKNAPRIKQLLIEFHDRLIGDSESRPSRSSISKLQQVGFRVFNVSRRGYEYSLLGPNFRGR